MKILGNDLRTSPVGAAKQKSIKELGAKEKVLDRFDQLIISRSAGNVPSDSQFVSLLKTQLQAEVHAGTPAHAVEDIKRQVALGSYDINPADIARKMMMDGEV